MNTNPDELTLARWLDDELTGKELADMEVWAAQHPEQCQAREELRRYRSRLKDVVSESEEPPYADFFLSRIRQGIRDTEQGKAKEPAETKPSGASSGWRNWLMPLAACAGVVLAFAIGRQMGGSEGLASKPIPAPVLYTPEEGVDAEWIGGNDTNATVIVLQGVSAIPDSTDFSSTVYVPRPREMDRTATREDEEPKSKQQ